MPLFRGEHGNAFSAAVDNGCGNFKRAHQLLDARADIIIPLSHGRHGSALCAAIVCADRKVEMVEFLLKAGADPNLSLHHGDYGNALCATCNAFHDVEMMDQLIKAGADVNMTLHHGAYGNTLSYAAGSTDYFGRPNIEAVKLLLKAGADVNPEYGDNDKACIPLLVAAQNDNAKIVQLLLDAGAKDWPFGTIPRVYKSGFPPRLPS